MIAQRLIADDPADFLDPTALLDRTAVETWNFERAADLEPWRQAKFDQRFELGPAGLILHSTKRRPRLRRAVDWQAGAVDALVVEVPKFERGISRLYWARDGEQLSEERSLAGRLDENAQPLSVTFDVVFHPAWRGRIRQLWVELFSPTRDEFRLRSVRVLRYRPLSSAVADAAARPWKIDLGHEVRSGLLALPGAPVVRRLEVPPSAALAVGFGTATGARQPIVFSAVLESGGETATLFEATVGPQPPSSPPEGSGEILESGRWHQREVDLGDFAGEATLRLEARAAEGEHDLTRGFAFWANPELLARAPAAGERDSTPAPNVVLISIDTLRADHLALYGYDRQTMPQLDAWAGRRAVVFANTVAPSPWTIPSHVSVFSGLDALHHGVNHPQPVPGSLEMMAELFRDSGYATLAITGGGFMRPQRGFAQGFDRYRYWPDAKSEAELDDGIGRALDWLDGVADRPFLLFFHTFEVHHPFRRRQPYFSQLAGEADERYAEAYLGLHNVQAGAEEGFLLAIEHFWKTRRAARERSALSAAEQRELVDRYDSGIAYADARLARLLARLEEGGLDRRTAVIVTSDHGEGLGEQGLAGHAYLYDWNLMVPLLIAPPEDQAARRSAARRSAAPRIETQVRLVDLLPTIAELAGLEAPPDLDGVSLVPLLEGRQAPRPRIAWSNVSFSNHGLALRVDNRLKYFYNNTAWAPLQGRERLFDLRRDPQELDDLAGSRDTAELRRQAQARLLESTTAFEVRFTNASDRAFSGHIAGGPVHHAMVKTAALPAGALTWREEGLADFHVRPGDDFRLFLERLDGWLELMGGFDASPGAAGGGGAFKARFEIEKLDGAWQLAYDGGAWSHGPAAAGDLPDTGVAIHWRGGGGPPASAAGSVDAQLTEQLRALGYLE